MLPRLAVLVVVALVGLGVPATAAGASQLPDLQCGVTPTTNVRLREDLTCSTWFDLYAHPASVDLGGHTLTDPALDCFGPCGAIGGATKLSNGTVIGRLWDDGLMTHLDVVGSIDFADVSGVEWFGNGTFGQPGSVRSSVVHGFVSIDGSDGIVAHNVVYGGVGVYDLIQGTGDVRISDNIIIGGGISYAAEVSGDFSGVIERNLVIDTSGIGIDLPFDVSGGPIAVTRNRVEGSTGDGIFVAAGYIVTFTGNVAIGNGGHGINVTGTDGGRNVAFDNTLEPQCVGIVCKP
jgi:hypothetical protein